MSDLTTADLRRLVDSGRVPPPEVTAARVRRWGVLLAVETWVYAIKGWAASMLVVVIGQPLFYLVSLGVGLGALVDAAGRTIDGVSYLLFVAPALLVSTSVMGGSGEFTYPVMAGFKWRRLYFGPVATPLTPTQLALGALGGPSVRFAIQAAVFWVAMLAFSAAPSRWSWLLIPIAVLSTVAVGAPLQAYSAGLEHESHQFASVFRFIIMPMFLFSGTFYPLSSIPVWLQWIGWISPVWHGAELARVASYGADRPLVMIVVHVLVLVAFTLVGTLFAVRRYERRLRR